MNSLRRVLVVTAILAVSFFGSLCFAAQQSTSTVTKAVQKPVIVKNVTGKTESITLGDPLKKTVSQILVVDDKGKKLRFLVGTKANVSDKDGKATTLGKLANGDKVTVEYTTGKSGTNIAKSIKLVD